MNNFNDSDLPSTHLKPQTFSEEDYLTTDHFDHMSSNFVENYTKEEKINIFDKEEEVKKRI